MSLLDELRKLASGVRGERATLQAELNEARARKKFLETAPACRAEVEAFFEQRYRAAVDEHRARFAKLIHDASDWGAMRVGANQNLTIVSPSPRSVQVMHADLEITMLGLFAEQIRVMYAKLLDSVDWSQSGPPAQERAAELEKVTARIGELETKLENIQREARAVLDA